MNPNPSLTELCPLDQTNDWRPLYLTTGKYKGLSIVECKSCKLQALFPRPNQKELYTKDYYQGKADYTYIDERDHKKFFQYVWKARIRNIKKFIKTGNFLDIGSSFGGFLESAKEEGFFVQGVEISEYASRYANTIGVPTFNGDLIEAKFPDHHFNVVTMIEVIEHIENPNLFFKELVRILKPGGLLLLQTANFDGWQAKTEGPRYHYYMPGHVFYYSDTILKKILTNLGFSHFVSYFGVDFPLYAKLQKSRGSFQNWKDYFQWFRISYYHFKSKWKRNGFPITSSYVLYAFKK
ncbi:class I SAM-dependent methyltransferase [Leptospira congkakensis]|uniref:Class I SAM-dependent methyltransferase n=1 Tax=Leptospira congkakensis TaxID=2484932 RepID=A0A4Z1AHW6_9LEPT|nr:class I SAM-dependent methyltransferase [Leptospira congkakensis]TGL90679.1 class I SAM-dependent methyltransferase [Leptospira congkakensis]TGL91686.1 class I SAM-dependent methyltransferase [Leptospira congkakensis]TGL98738.1 class I SAM-dependent methyltransferase [Leptospira congkakensis]